MFLNPNQWCNWEKSNVSFPELSSGVLSQLGKDIDKDEVQVALLSMKQWKAPRNDGFPAGFYQKNRDMVGGEVSNFVINS